MNKLHVNTAFGRNRPRFASAKLAEAVVASSRPFHISAVRAADEESSAGEFPFSDGGGPRIDLK